MPLKEEFERTGQWLFRWRSYLPGVYLALLMTAMCSFDYLGHRHLYQEIWAAVCLTVSLCGLAVRAAVVGHAPRGTSGRNTSQQIADTLNTTGMYSVMRHPLYVGNFFIWLGITMFCLLWWMAVIYVLMFWFYYERIMFAEEEFLRRKFGDSYLQWAEDTPAIVPRWRRWQRPATRFSWRNVLRREYPGFLGVFAAFAALEIGEHIVVEHRIELEHHWAMLLLAAGTVFLLLRTLKRRTTILDVTGY
jgi:protein-S-isoprenylcysteine O-methyltransferase Ste14